MDLIIREASENDNCSILSLINNELGYPDVTLDNWGFHGEQASELNLQYKKD